MIGPSNWMLLIRVQVIYMNSTTNVSWSCFVTWFRTLGPLEHLHHHNSWPRSETQNLVALHKYKPVWKTKICLLANFSSKRSEPFNILVKQPPSVARGTLILVSCGVVHVYRQAINRYGQKPKSCNCSRLTMIVPVGNSILLNCWDQIESGPISYCITCNYRFSFNLKLVDKLLFCWLKIFIQGLLESNWSPIS